MKLYNGDSIEVLKTFEENSIDACVTDPPYSLVSITKRFGKEGSAPAQYGKDGSFSRLSKGFMGKEWDGTFIEQNVDFWKEVLRVLKPGGHLLAFGGTRTYHRMACAVEDAGFEIRDQIQWLYGSGFPKSHNIGKIIDKKNSSEREVIGFDKSGSKRNCMAGDFKGGEYELTKGCSEWEGWGTALKPANEPIVLARKPLSEKTIVDNVLKWRTGALNIDGTRIELNQNIDDPRLGGKGSWQTSKMAKNVYEGEYSGEQISSSELGRWPANVIHDGSEDVLKYFPDSKGQQGNVKGDEPRTGIYGVFDRKPFEKRNDEGTSARFFYCAKASRKERGENNNHPTVKPVKLMKYLIRLITPKGGIVLDPFMGSGTTGLAAKLEGIDFIGIEKEKEYFDIATNRLKENAIEKMLREND